MTGVVFEETAVAPAPVSLPLSHLSVELGHLYMEDFDRGPAHLTAMMHQVAPWARTAVEVVTAAVAPKRARVSTCFLVDDYFSPLSSPAEVVPMLLEAAAAAGLSIDYLARESACARTDEVDVAELVAGRLVADPPPETTGGRPPTPDSGWLCNGIRSPQPVPAQAMRAPVPWRPPSENGANRHGIFVDVELWSEQPDRRLWSCPFLAAVWQLLRLGLLRTHGEPVIVARPSPAALPDAWTGLPPITQLRPEAAPFAAYRTFSVLAGRFLAIEHSVRTILSQVAVEQAVTAEIDRRAAGERLVLPGEIVDRIEYAFAGTAWRAG